MNDDGLALEIAPLAALDAHGDGDAAEAREGSGAALALAVVETEARQRPATARIAGIVIGRVASASAEDGVRVDHPANPSGDPLSARSTVEIGAADVGREVALAFEQGDAARPVVLGLIHPPAAAMGERAPLHAGITADGERLTLTAGREIVLTCGDASITLTRAGKILVRGAYLLSRSTGVNRIKGASVQIN